MGDSGTVETPNLEYRPVTHECSIQIDRRSNDLLHDVLSTLQCRNIHRRGAETNRQHSGGRSESRLLPAGPAQRVCLFLMDLGRIWDCRSSKIKVNDCGMFSKSCLLEESCPIELGSYFYFVWQKKQSGRPLRRSTESLAQWRKHGSCKWTQGRAART